MTNTTAPAQSPEVAAFAEKIARCAAQIAEGGHDRQVSLRKGYDEVIITLAPDATRSVWEVSGVGLYHTSHGANVGDTHRRTYLDIDEARDYANGWFAHLTAKGYQRTR